MWQNSKEYQKQEHGGQEFVGQWRNGLHGLRELGKRLYMSEVPIIIFFQGAGSTGGNNIAQANFNMVLGCKIPSLEHIDNQERGVFEAFRGLEKFGRWAAERIIPARASTGCKFRKSACCSIGTCGRAVSGLQALHVVHWQAEGKRM
jgi:hypothetical protein